MRVLSHWKSAGFAVLMLLNVKVAFDGHNLLIAARVTPDVIKAVFIILIGLIGTATCLYALLGELENR